MGAKGEVSAKKRYLAMVMDWSLAEHDAKYHGGKFDPKTMSCGKREEMSKGDDPKLGGGAEVSPKWDDAHLPDEKGAFNDYVRKNHPDIAGDLAATGDLDWVEASRIEKLADEIRADPWAHLGEDTYGDSIAALAKGLAAEEAITVGARRSRD